MFKVGEIVIGQNFILATSRNGMEAEIIGALEMRQWIIRDTGRMGESVAYKVRWADGEITSQEPPYLRRKKPPTTGEDAIMALLKRVPHREPEPA